MKIRHLTNSFIEVEAGKTRLLTDPWSGYANYGGWQSNPVYSENELKIVFKDVTALYISHIHSDHFHPETLSLIENKDIPVYIKNFKTKRLYQKLVACGFHNIIEMTEWQKYNLNDLCLVCTPQIESNSSGLEDNLNYDLDTSLIVNDNINDILFFHKVDNPLSLGSLQDIKLYCEKTFGKSPDICTLTCGAASEWPQCFPKLDRKKAKKEFINESLKIFSKQVSALDAKFIIPGGGRYVISGRYAGLNNFLAVATHSQMKEHLPKGVKLLDIEGGGEVEITKSIIKVRTTELRSTTKEEILKLSSNPYDFECITNSFDQQQYEAAVNNWLERIRSIGIKPDCSIDFHLYSEIKIDVNGNCLNVFEGGGKKILNLVRVKENEAHIEIHLEERALSAVLNQNLILKQIMSGSLTIQYRNPEKFFPSTMFALAFFGS